MAEHVNVRRIWAKRALRMGVVLSLIMHGIIVGAVFIKGGSVRWPGVMISASLVFLLGTIYGLWWYKGDDVCQCQECKPATAAGIMN